jgi:ferredoxin
MRVVVDPTKCAGMGVCEGIDSQRFQVQSDGKTLVLNDVLDDGQAREVVQEAVDMCPTEALRLVD